MDMKTQLGFVHRFIPSDKSSRGGTNEHLSKGRAQSITLFYSMEPVEMKI
jgi:hypothetical protein